MQFLPAIPVVVVITVLAASGCAVAQDAEPVLLVEPKVVMEADPPPPFTYWAPEGSTIRNHPLDPMTWIAESADRSRKYYFGDQCRASQFQRLVGQPLDALPDKPAGATWRLACSTCAVISDLGRERMNVFYDKDFRAITSISCG
ncbi:hypothetical protein [Chelativorans sp. AA-79]|uniref:hypothetical protein n=1 Tax=Chelativorans sp. AA-79 TaxID=3028735 RepID=UPI0023F61854|nr:hypothetical protein [Chelativorans sp. AA-79]WEX08496.1 hypothetical protein PVE73_20850 [Chelativorans sp. AA-79]